MGEVVTAAQPRLSTSIGIGGMTVRVHTSDAAFLSMVEERYAGFPGLGESADYEFEVELIPNLSPSNRRMSRARPSSTSARPRGRAEFR
jgi:hypothetical protein